LKSDNPFEILENKQQARGNTQPHSVEVFDWEIQEFGIYNLSYFFVSMKEMFFENICL